MAEIVYLPELEKEQLKELRAGDLCPRCAHTMLDYDGLLNLACSGCGYAVGGCYT